MSFREKSAWIMIIALLLGGLFYFRAVLSEWSASGQLISPALPSILWYAGLLVSIAVIGHIAIVAFAPNEGDEPVDEREKLIFERSGHYSSYVFAAGVVASLGLYVFSANGDILFYTVFASLMMAQIFEYFFQILFYRTSV